MNTKSNIKTGLFLLLSFCILTVLPCYGQVINAYAKVTSISGNTLNLSNVNETFHTFTIGEPVIIMQMQDDVISGTTNNSSFGSLGSIGSAGLYEVQQISGKTATTLTLASSLTNTYNTGTNSSVQVISLRVLGSPNYSTTANITALDWDGNVGGVVALRVNGTLTLNHDITANGAGFRGGSRSTNEGTVDCNTAWITNLATLSGEKGEGIYKRTDANYQYGRAKILNGGGGGNRHNAGGGGGGNVTSGGDGGPGYLCSASPVGGQGGLSLNSQISVNRIFMGGGGGGGQQNNSVGTNGTDGGGIVLINATQIITSGTCGARTISANGLNASNANNDGSGGGGAGGTIIFDVANFSIPASCPISVSADGGNGGSSLNSTAHGGGGGGGQGRIIFSGSAPANVTVNTNNGTSGCNNNSSPCSSQATSASGTNGSGISDSGGNTPLPVSLIYFTGNYNKESGTIELKWATASELNNQYFTVESSVDGLNFTEVGNIAGHGTTSLVSKYEFEDSNVHGDSRYYRLSQTDFDGTKEYFKVIRVYWDREVTSIWIYPNPVDQPNSVNIDFEGLQHGDYSISISNINGLEIYQSKINIENNFQSMLINTSRLPAGVYSLRIYSKSNSYHRKIIVR